MHVKKVLKLLDFLCKMHIKAYIKALELNNLKRQFFQHIKIESFNGI